MKHLLLALSSLLVVAACSRSEKAPTPAEPTPTPSTAAAGLPPEPITVHERVVTCTWTGKYAESFGDELASFECKSSAKKPLERLQFWVYYYDENGKQLERFGHSLEEPSGVLLEPGAVKTFSLGKARPKEPIHAKKIEVEASRGVYTDGEAWENAALAPEERPLGG